MTPEDAYNEWLLRFGYRIVDFKKDIMPIVDSFRDCFCALNMTDFVKYAPDGGNTYQLRKEIKNDTTT